MTATSVSTYESVSVFAPVGVQAERRSDEVVILRNQIWTEPTSATMPQRLRLWAERRPGQTYLSQGIGEARREVAYGEALDIARRWGARLAALRLSIDRPLAIIAPNSIDHALLTLAAAMVGVPAAIVTPAYAQTSAAPYTKFRKVVESVTPGLIVTDNVEAVTAALAAIGAEGVAVRPISDLSWLETIEPVSDAELAGLEAAVGPDTVAKLLFTSGSTGSPKPVPNTQRMMASNMEALAQVWTFLEHRPPSMVDWLPWSHTFGGNCCFNLALYFGGSFHIDDGKPLPALVGRTIDALKALQPNVYFNVPAGFDALLPTLEADKAFARAFFSGLEFIFNAGAALPAPTRRRLEAAARAAIDRTPPIIGAWGATETAPFSTVIYFETEHASNLGVPLPGVEIKLQPFAGRSELRVRGPNVMPGYWKQPEATADAFDDEGFYRIGDAGRLIDADAPEKGILFDGRVAENFKLVSGTWVRVGALRLAVIAAARPLISDAVIAGEGRDSIGLLVFPDEAACRAAIEEAGEKPTEGQHPGLHPVVTERIRQALRLHNAEQHGGSTQVARFSVMTEPPSAQNDETTEKGYINQRGVLSRRAEAVTALYADGHEVGA